MINIKLGIVYYFDELKLHNKLEYIEYIKISNTNEINLTNKPTLIVGWSLAKEKFKKSNILNKKINNLYYWTFSFNEKSVDYINDIEKFVTYDILNIFKFYNYTVLSPIFNSELNTSSGYIKYFEDCELNSIVLSKNMQLTILCNNDIYRINMKELNYYNIDSKTILKYLKNKYSNFFYDKNGTLEDKYLKFFHKIDPNIVLKYIPLFYKANIVIN
jgi:hypothetical protein